MKSFYKKSPVRISTILISALFAGLVANAQQESFSLEKATPIDPAIAQQIVINNQKKLGISPYFDNRLSSEQCTYVVSEVMKIQAYNSKEKTLNSILEHLLMECEVASTTSIIESEPIGYRFESSNLFVLWDGSTITFNEKAESTLELTMRANFKNIVKISKANLESSAAPSSSFMDRIQNKVNSVKSNLFEVYENGKTHIIFSGVAYHKRSSYPNWRSLNEFAAGVGIERARITNNGNRESISAMVFLDSHSDPEYSISYELAKPWSLGNNVLVWAGVNAGLTSRRDIMNHIPVPYVFPTLGLSVGKLAVRSILIPRIGSAGGNVLFLFGSYQM